MTDDIFNRPLRRCDNCKLQGICNVKSSFDKSLLDSRSILDKDKYDYSEICEDVMITLAKYCKYFGLDDKEFYG